MSSILSKPLKQPKPRLASCDCNYCSGHLDFDLVHTGKSIPCAHCGIETALVVPVTKSVLPQTGSSHFNFLVAGFVLIVSMFIFAACDRPKPVVKTSIGTNAVVEGAFGWKLGDKLAAGTIFHTNDDSEFADYKLDYTIFPENPPPPFDRFYLYVTSDGRIAEIEAFGSCSSAKAECEKIKNTMVQALTEKYGIRYKSDDTSGFGTGDRYIILSTSGSFSLTYVDAVLVEQEQAECRQRAEAAKQRARDEEKLEQQKIKSVF